MTKSSISLLAIVLNEEEDLPGLLASCYWVDELVIIDGGSTDKTVGIAKNAGARVITRKFDDFGSQRKFALEQACTEWVLMLDADERPSRVLIDEIKKIIGREDAADVYRIPIETEFWGRCLKHVWNGPPMVRLFRKKAVSAPDSSVHESMVARGVVASIPRGIILHKTYKSVFEHLKKINLYTQLSLESDVNEWRSRGRMRWYQIIGIPIINFCWRYLIRLGFMDGLPGLVMCLQVGYISFVRLIKVYERIYLNAPASNYSEE
jgi:glycosyltransferase involved in cell wall biosynthesis